MLTRAWAALLGGPAAALGRVPIIVRKEHTFGVSHEIAIGVHTDAVFGQVLTFGGGGAATGIGERVVLPNRG